jgi:hypothetical protein
MSDEKCNYDKIIYDGYSRGELLLRALEIVKKFVIDRKCLMAGGMAVDLPLKMKGATGIYDEFEIPDYDFFTPDFDVCAYDLARELCVAGFKDITVINALHVTTMKVRLAFDVVADITYMPKKLFDITPFILIDNMRVIHPFYIMLTQHSSLCQPYANYPREVIFQRWAKDIERLTLLSENFKIEEDKSFKRPKYVTKKIYFDEFEQNICLVGWSACEWYLDKFAENTKNAENAKNIDFIQMKFPEFDTRIHMLCDKWYVLLEDKYGKDFDKKFKYFNAFMDFIPRRVETNEFLIYDCFGLKISAVKIDANLYIANLQFLLLWLLCNILYFDGIKNTDESAIYKFYYCSLSKVVESGIDEFMPSAKVYPLDGLSIGLPRIRTQIQYLSEIDRKDIIREVEPSAVDSPLTPAQLNMGNSCNIIEPITISKLFTEIDFQETSKFTPLDNLFTQ